MRAAGLHAIATILDTEAVLIKSAAPKPNRPPHLASTISLVTARIAGVIAAARYVVCQYNVHRDLIPKVSTITPGRRAPTISPLEDDGYVAVSVMVEKGRIAQVMDELVETGATDLMIFNLDNCRV
jgi:ATP phosphoribosyltransferase